MLHFYKPDLTTDPDSPFVRDAADKLVNRRGVPMPIGVIIR